MSRPGIVPGPPAWEASTLEKIQLESLFAIYSEPLLELRLALQQQQPGLYRAKLNCSLYRLLMFRFKNNRKNFHQSGFVSFHLTCLRQVNRA
jgi:hypothetical protein